MAHPAFWKYMDMYIYPCESIYFKDDRPPHNGRYMVQTFHGPTGIPFADELCPHFRTIKAAKEAIRIIHEMD